MQCKHKHSWNTFDFSSLRYNFRHDCRYFSRFSTKSVIYYGHIGTEACCLQVTLNLVSVFTMALFHELYSWLKESGDLPERKDNHDQEAEYLLEEQRMSKISLMKEPSNISVFFMADGPEKISFPYFCQCRDFDATVCFPTCQTLGVLNSLHLS